MSFAVKGWCPGAHRPMMSGDGYVVRVRPRLARLTSAQATGLCEAAAQHGAGLIDVTNRANIQIRGVSEAAWPALMTDLEALGLLDTDADTETRRNIVVNPDWVAGDDTERLAIELIDRLAELPALPPKMGVAIDAGVGPILHETSADFRLERSALGLILRADGHDLGLPLEPGQEIDALMRLAEWFIASGGAEVGRMARHAAPLPDWAQGTQAPATARPKPPPGAHPIGAVYGLGFGQVRAVDLMQAIRDSRADALRITPWRMLLLEEAEAGARAGLIGDANSPLMRVDACPGAPFCPQSSVETRALAAQLAPVVKGQLHVSGCAKGCARKARADTVVIGDHGRFNIALNACAGDDPVETGLTHTQILDYFGAA
mgnify:FL=1